ncbi:MAG: hypothetical protein ACR2KS_08300 [Candidatus Eremiobacter antarcticus]
MRKEIASTGVPLLRRLAAYAADRAGVAPEKIAAQRFPFWRPLLSKAQTSRLLDYLVFDHHPAGHSRPAAAQFRIDQSTTLPPAWHELLQRWEGTPTGLYELESWSGEFARCRDALGDAGSIEVVPLERSSPRVSNHMAIALRPLPLNSGFMHPAALTVFEGRAVGEIADAVRSRHHAFVRSTRIVSLADFLALAPTVLDEEAAVSPLGSRIVLPGS